MRRLTRSQNSTQRHRRCPACSAARETSRTPAAGPACARTLQESCQTVSAGWGRGEPQPAPELLPHRPAGTRAEPGQVAPHGAGATPSRSPALPSLQRRSRAQGCPPTDVRHVTAGRSLAHNQHVGMRLSRSHTLPLSVRPGPVSLPPRRPLSWTGAGRAEAVGRRPHFFSPGQAVILWCFCLPEKPCEVTNLISGCAPSHHPATSASFLQPW